jgi:hypothetical protein
MDLALSEVEHAIAKLFKSKYGLAWPFASHLAKDAVSILEFEKLKAERAIVGDPRQRITVPTE